MWWLHKVIHDEQAWLILRSQSLLTSGVTMYSSGFIQATQGLMLVKWADVCVSNTNTRHAYRLVTVYASSVSRQNSSGLEVTGKCPVVDQRQRGWEMCGHWLKATSWSNWMVQRLLVVVFYKSNDSVVFLRLWAPAISMWNKKKEITQNSTKCQVPVLIPVDLHIWRDSENNNELS